MNPSQVSLRSPSMQRILAVVRAHGPLTAQEIARKAFVAETSVYNGNYMPVLLEAGLIHVSGELPSTRSRRPYKLYSAGPKP